MYISGSSGVPFSSSGIRAMILAAFALLIGGCCFPVCRSNVWKKYRKTNRASLIEYLHPESGYICRTIWQNKPKSNRAKQHSKCLPPFPLKFVYPCSLDVFIRVWARGPFYPSR